jgi:V/A-type H+-transporting ATPase subunit A
VGAFHGLTRERSDARKYPAIHPLESWSKYHGVVDDDKTEVGRDFLFRSFEVGQMMKVVGEEGTSLDDFVVYQKGEFVDTVYLQQNSFDPVDASVGLDRQRYMYDIVYEILTSQFKFDSKETARLFFAKLKTAFGDWNSCPWQSSDFKDKENVIRSLLTAQQAGR